MSNKLVSKYSFEMPEVGENITLTVSNCASISPYCWIWNASVGYLEVINFKEPEVTVRNNGRIENAKAGSEFPSCMEFLIVAPDSIPLNDTTVTCLAADFISPAVGDTAIMVVEDTSNIRETDIIIVDRKYRYTVINIIDEHQLEVRNEGWGKEPGEVIDIVCDECIPVKILESTYCCKVVREELQKEIDDILDRLDDKKSILASDLNNLVTVSGGTHVQTDAPYDTVIYVDNDLSHYNNNNSQFITINDVGNGILTIEKADGTDIGYFRANQFGNTVVTLPAINNGILTIKNSGGTSLGTFTANQSGNTDITLPAINNGTLTIKTSGGNSLGTFTANQSGNTDITLPAAPTVNDGHLNITIGGTTYTFTANQSGDTDISIPASPSVPSRYSGIVTDYQSTPGTFSVELHSSKNTGAADNKSITSSNYFTPVSFTATGTSGAKANIYGTIILTCSGEFSSDTHTYNLRDAVPAALAPRITFVTARGPHIKVDVEPKISGNSIYNQPISSGYNYYLRLDNVNAPNGESVGSNREFSIQITIPIAYEINVNSSYNVSLDITLSAKGLRNIDQNSSGNNFVNEEIYVKFNKITAHTALEWVIK